MMKRAFLTLVLLLVSTILVSAQIQRKFINSTLGVSTKSQISSYLRNNNYDFASENGHLEIYNLNFAGHTWPVVFLEFHNGVLYCLDFRDGEGFTPVELLNSAWMRYRRSLLEKYSEYLCESDKEHLEFSDERTVVSLDFKYSLGEKSLSIMYYDLNLLLQQSIQEENEL